MNIRSIKIDFDNEILEINGEPIKRATVVSLPFDKEWLSRKGFNLDKFEHEKDYYDRITVSFTMGNQK